MQKILSVVKPVLVRNPTTPTAAVVVAGVVAVVVAGYCNLKDMCKNKLPGLLYYMVRYKKTSVSTPAVFAYVFVAIPHKILVNRVT